MGAWARAAAQPAQAEQQLPPSCSGQGFPGGLSLSSSHQLIRSIHETKAQPPTNTGAAKTHSGQAGRALAELSAESCSSCWRQEHWTVIYSCSAWLVIVLLCFFVVVVNEPKDLWVCIKDFSVWVLKHQHSIEQNILVRMNLNLCSAQSSQNVLHLLWFKSHVHPFAPQLSEC